MLYQTTRVPDYQATRLQGFQTTDGKNRRVTFGDLVPDKDSRSLFTSLHCTMSIGHFSIFFTISQTVAGRFSRNRRRGEILSQTRIHCVLWTPGSGSIRFRIADHLVETTKVQGAMQVHLAWRCFRSACSLSATASN